jgi:mannose-6-phosphate isomerase
MYRLKGSIQHYSWGGNTYLPGYLNEANKEQKPYAEYWLGVHAGGPATIDLGNSAHTLLSHLISSDKLKHLGKETYHQFNGLPFLLKILDVKDMLSIQVHPNKLNAQKGFEREEKEGVSLTAPHRNYKDQNHKPEVMIALSNFWLLHGFSDRIEERLTQYEFLKKFLPIYKTVGIQGLYEHLLSMPQEMANEIIGLHAQYIVPLYNEHKLEKTNPDFWAARAILNLCREGNYDKGIFSIYLMNILHLQPGDGIFQGAGLLHAYLEGQNIELMANSDNVLRAGLTNKHIDIPELLANTSFVVTIPNIIPASLNKGVKQYVCDTPDFQIQKLILGVGEECSLQYNGPAIMLQLAGKADWQGFNHFSTEGLTSFFIDPQEPVMVKARTGLEVYIASVPV